MESEIELLKNEIVRLKRSSRVSRALAASGLLAVFGYFAACGQPQAPPGVQTGKLEIVDAAGKTQGIFFSDKEGAGLSLNDAAGKPRIVFAASAQRPTIELYDDKGKVRATLSVEKDGSTMAFTDESGLPRASIGFFKGESWAAFNDAKGNLTARVPEN